MQITLKANAVVGLMLSFGVVTVATPIRKSRPNTYFTNEDVSTTFGFPGYGNRPGSVNYPTDTKAGGQNNYRGHQDNSADKDKSYQDRGHHRDNYGKGTDEQNYSNYGQDNSDGAPAAVNNDYRQQQHQDSSSMEKGKSYQDRGYHQSSGFRKEYHRIENGHRTKYFDSYENKENPVQYNEEEQGIYDPGDNLQNHRPIVNQQSNTNNKYGMNRAESYSRHF